MAKSDREVFVELTRLPLGSSLQKTNTIEEALINLHKAIFGRQQNIAHIVTRDLGVTQSAHGLSFCE